MKKTIPIMALAAVASFAAPTLNAATIVHTKYFDFIPDASQILTFDKFNTNDGTLTAITITTYVTKLNGSLYVDNDAATGASGAITQTVTINLTSANALVDAGLNPIGSNIQAISSYTATVGADDGDTDLILNNNDGYQSGGTDSDGTSFASVSTSESKNLSNLAWGQYSTAGYGTYTITASGIQSLNTSAISGAAGAFTPASASGYVQVTYTYLAIPEPSAALLGGLGLLALLRRRR
jgi:hypothetical protein